MRILSIPVLVALPLLGSVASAHDDGSPWYLQFNAGFNYVQDSADAVGGDLEFDDGFAVSALVGYDLFDFWGERLGLALEFETYFTDFEVSSDGFGSVDTADGEDSSTVALMVNLAAEWHWTPQISLYGAAGIGHAPSIDFDSYNNLENNFELTETDALAWQGKIGMRYNLGGSFSWLFGYRYFATDDVEMENDGGAASFDMENVHHVFEFGVRWSG
jgi:opacity protein-like surface antigen